MSEKKKVVVVGGGNGAAVSILALKRYLDLFDISAIISMSDSGGSSGKLRRELQILPPGDILRAMLAMSKYDYYTLRQIFYEVRFEETGKLTKHNLGNLFLSLTAQYGGDTRYSYAALQQSLACVGSVYPVTIEQSDLSVEYADGSQEMGEGNIDRPKPHDWSNPIKKAWLEPQAALYAPAKKALLAADYIVFGPGSLFCSILPNILVSGFVEAIQKSSAKLVYIVGNGYEADGEVGPRSVAGFVEVLQSYLPRKIDMVIYNTEKLANRELKFYESKKWEVSARDVEKLKDFNLVGFEFERDGGGLSKEKLGEAFKQHFN